ASGLKHTPASAHMSQTKQLKGVGRRDQLDRQSSVSSGWGNPSLPPPHDPSITPSPSKHASIPPLKGPGRPPFIN
ncbi:hypothetical protein ABG768_025615, partial [Culter alburnus]